MTEKGLFFVCIDGLDLILMKQVPPDTFLESLENFV